MVNPVEAIVKIAIALIVVGGLLYLFFARSNAVEKTGYGALIMLTVVSIMIPIFWILETNGEAMAKSQQHTVAVTRGMQLYAQYCIDQCYTISGGKVVDPKYNGYAISDLNNMKDEELLRVISAGIYNPSAPQPSNPNAVPKAQQYGGQLDENQAQYLFEFLRSADPAYLQKNGYPANSAANGFNQLVSYVQTNFPSVYATAAAPPPTSANQFGKPVDMTGTKTITLNIVNSPPGAKCQPACYDPINVKVKVGTVITWVNKSSTPHTVTAIQGTNVNAPKAAPQIFDSGVAKSLNTGGTFKYTVTAAAYTFNADHTVFYYCQIHATSMFAELVIVK